MNTLVTDSTNTLSLSSKLSLAAAGDASPFRVKVIFEASTRPELQAHVHAAVDTPNTLVIGVDPVHKFTWTEIGVDTGIKSGDYQQVGRAGNADFKAGQWVDGVKDIISRATALRTRTATDTTTPVIVQETRPQTVIDHGVPAWPFVSGGLLLGGVVLWVALTQRKARRRLDSAVNTLAEERSEFLDANVKRMTAPESGLSGEPLPARAPIPAILPASVEPDPIQLARAQRAQAAARPPLVLAEPRPVFPPVRVQRRPEPAPVVIIERDNGPSFAEGVLLGQALNQPPPAIIEEPYPRHHHRRRERTPSPAPSYRSKTPTPAPSSDSGGSIFSSFSSDTSSDTSSSGGGGGGDIGGSDSGGGGGGSFE